MSWKTLAMLIAMFIGYLLIGAITFQALEKPAEEEQCRQAKMIVRNISEKIENSSVPIAEVLNLTEVGTTTIKAIHVCDNLTVTCSTNWDLEGSFLFCGSVLTTIGYGRIAPTTYLGKMVCMAYSSAGIPIFAQLFSGLGITFGIEIGKLQMKVRGLTNSSRERRKIVTVIVLSTFIIFFLLIPASIFVYVEGWDFSDSFYYAYFTLSTVGFGDFVPGTNPLIDYIPMYRVMVFFWIVFGLAFAFAVISFLKKLWTKPGPAGIGGKNSRIGPELSPNSDDGMDTVIQNLAFSIFDQEGKSKEKNPVVTGLSSSIDNEDRSIEIQNPPALYGKDNTMDISQVANYLFAITRRQPFGNRTDM